MAITKFGQRVGKPGGAAIPGNVNPSSTGPQGQSVQPDASGVNAPSVTGRVADGPKAGQVRYGALPPFGTSIANKTAQVRTTKAPGRGSSPAFRR
jgi:hypothetical protein